MITRLAIVMVLVRDLDESLRFYGVQYVSPPTDQYYGVEAVFVDPYGNTYSMVERK